MTYTRLLGKEASPLVVRKYTLLSIPVFVAIITDDDIRDIDNVVVPLLRRAKGKLESIQDFRNLAADITDALVSAYEKTEGAAVVMFPDKAAVSSLWGDFMNHLQCKIELYTLIATMTQV